ncbi:hypothetical protein [Kitasatospora sp. NPDC059327]|uniref:hypothetical protein n=1 Tax=Kitasatospora sp. NPDC059327 TaxID=3346803 RepID=UPI00367A7C2B
MGPLPEQPPVSPVTSPVAEVAVEVRAEHHLFHLVDTAAPPGGEPDDEPETPRHGQLATTAPGTGTVTFNSALSDHYPHVSLQHWRTPPPPPPPGDWPHQVRLAVDLQGGRLTLASGVSRLPTDAALRLPPGRYTLTAYRSALRPTREPLPRGAEQWLLRLWPVAAVDDDPARDRGT